VSASIFKNAKILDYRYFMWKGDDRMLR